MIAANAGHALGLVLVDELARCGLRHVAIAPGSRSTPLALAFEEHDDIRTHIAIDERAAAFLAVGVGRGSGVAAAALCTSGTAAANLLPAVVEADAGMVPLLVVTADRPPELRGTGANQTIDQLKMYGSATRWFCDMGVPEARSEMVRYWRSTACRAWAEAMGSPPGPVHLNAPLREPLGPTDDGVGFPHALDGRAARRPWTEFHAPPAAPSGREIDIVQTAIEHARRPVVVAGACDVDPEPVLAFASPAGCPVLPEPASGLRRKDPAVIASYEALLRAPRFVHDHPPDLIVRFGKLGISRPLARLLDRADIPQIAIDPHRAWLDEVRTASALVACRPDLLFGSLEPPRSDGTWLDSWTRADAAAIDAIDEVLDARTEPTEPRIARDLAVCLPDDADLVVASSMPVRDLAAFMRPRSGLRVRGNRGANGIDGTVSTAAGVALASGIPTAALVGDLALMHDQNGLRAALSARADLTIVVVNNDGGGIFSFLPQSGLNAHFERLFGTPHGMSVAALASAHGARHSLIERAGDLPDAVLRSLSTGGVEVVEARTDRTANVALHQELWRAVEAALVT